LPRRRRHRQGPEPQTKQSQRASEAVATCKPQMYRRKVELFCLRRQSRGRSKNFFGRRHAGHNSSLWWSIRMKPPSFVARRFQPVRAVLRTLAGTPAKSI
jgi:hypothetical protein